MRRYIDFKLIEEYPNKYNLTPKNIKKLVILDWDRLKCNTWKNNAMLNGNWWCHLEGCNINGNFDDEYEFWIGFNEKNNKVDCNFSCWSGMGRYKFDKFYENINNRFELYVQVNTIRWLNLMIDDGILGIKEK